jgi:lipoate-protein ligase A
MITALEFPLLQPAELLATEETLLDAAEAGECGETLSFWESPTHFVVLGYGNKVSTEVNQAACERLGIPILRRISGGGTVLQGPGVLNYSLILRADKPGPLASIHGANQFIMQRNAEALTKLLNAEGPAPNAGERVEVQGHTDLAIGGRKFSGNAQRRKRTHLLFHGSIVLNVDLELLDQVLPSPTLQPEYRQGRKHRDFLTQFPRNRDVVVNAITQAWSGIIHNSRYLEKEWLAPRRQALLVGKYAQSSWNLRA